MGCALAWQAAHHNEPGAPQPPQRGGKMRSTMRRQRATEENVYSATAGPVLLRFWATADEAR